MFAVILIPDFSLQAVLRYQPELKDAAVALLNDAASKATILQMTDAARAADVEPGMTPAQAMARCPDLQIKLRSRAQEASSQQALLQCAYAFSPFIESTADGICTMSLRGSPMMAPSQLADSSTDDLPQFSSNRLRAWAIRLIDALARMQLRAQVGVAATPELALLAAQCARPFLTVPSGKAFLADQPIKHLEPSNDAFTLLHRWGIRTIGEFIALGKEQLTMRLGQEAVTLFERATAARSRPLKLTHPPEIFEEAIEFPSEIESLEPLLFVLRNFLDQLTQRLEIAYLVVEELDLTLSLASGENYERNFKVPAPTRAIEPLFRMLQTHLENLKTEAPITALCLAAKPCHAEGYQLGLFEASLRDPNHFSETVSRLTALLGPDRVGTPALQPSYRADDFRMEPLCLDSENNTSNAPSRVRNQPKTRTNRLHLKQSSPALPDPKREAQRKQIRDIVKAVLPPAPNTPTEPPAVLRYGPALRRFRPALPISVELKNNRPVYFRGAKIKTRILQTSGPWRSSGSWWDRSWKRDEWDVETAGGRGYRIYQEGDSWFLEGIFD